MSPKSKENAEKRSTLIGRVGTNLKVGIVGLPNVGRHHYYLCIEIRFVNFSITVRGTLNTISSFAAVKYDLPFNFR
ncbi:hypothetical protein D918_09989 [Trichuris suis]|nr:hypothetical protein D918_09989 [Trichuris suis]